MFMKRTNKRNATCFKNKMKVKAEEDCKTNFQKKWQNDACKRNKLYMKLFHKYIIRTEPKNVNIFMFQRGIFFPALHFVQNEREINSVSDKMKTKGAPITSQMNMENQKSSQLF